MILKDLQNLYKQERPDISFELWAEMKGYKVKVGEREKNNVWLEILFYLVLGVYLWGLWKGIEWLIEKI